MARIHADTTPDDIDIPSFALPNTNPSPSTRRPSYQHTPPPSNSELPARSKTYTSPVRMPTSLKFRRVAAIRTKVHSNAKDARKRIMATHGELAHAEATHAGILEDITHSEEKVANLATKEAHELVRKGSSRRQVPLPHDQLG
jgi:hypothetical protein